MNSGSVPAAERPGPASRESPGEQSAPLLVPSAGKGAGGSGMASEGESINLQFLLSPQGMNPHLRTNGPMNINHYATKKSVAESMLDVALFMANVTQLKAVLEQGTSFQYYTTLIVLISISLFFQVVIGILLIITARLNLNDVAKQPRLNILNNAATALIFITVIINIFITAFGVQKTGLYPTRNFRPY
ncbi:ninjurin-2 isoform X4 [Coturnix japonica]|uniref:ninjurin-2 isoform X4 n=1 Tax=Coturnix japonica TaxID=93934 RepID=UPI0013A5EA4F|nr:ninjurin-2 isoform X4 [Coturnix japonica]